MQYYPTHTLQLLIGNKLLKEKLKFIFPENKSIIEVFLRKLYFKKEYDVSEMKQYIPELLKYGFVTEKPAEISPNTGTLMFASVINFELTYECQYVCPHCLQINMRRK